MLQAMVHTPHLTHLTKHQLTKHQLTKLRLTHRSHRSHRTKLRLTKLRLTIRLHRAHHTKLPATTPSTTITTPTPLNLRTVFPTLNTSQLTPKWINSCPMPHMEHQASTITTQKTNRRATTPPTLVPTLARNPSSSVDSGPLASPKTEAITTRLTLFLIGG